MIFFTLWSTVSNKYRNVETFIKTWRLWSITSPIGSLLSRARRSRFLYSNQSQPYWDPTFHIWFGFGSGCGAGSPSNFNLVLMAFFMIHTKPSNHAVLQRLFIACRIRYNYFGSGSHFRHTVPEFSNFEVSLDSPGFPSKPQVFLVNLKFLRTKNTCGAPQ